MPLQATSGAASYDGFGGGVVAEPNYIESCFSTYLYTGNDSTQTITNGIDLSTKGGLVWIKSRSNAQFHRIFDTARGVNKSLSSNSTNAQNTAVNTVTAFNATGFSLGDDSDRNGTNTNAYTYASWTFRKQPKFFDVVTGTADAATGYLQMSHSLGSVPGAVIFKSTTGTSQWAVYHRSLTTNYNLRLNSNAAQANDNYQMSVTSTTVTMVNANPGEEYVAYLFAHNAGGFGLTGTDNVISCGSYSGTGSPVTVTLGYEPQWLLIKESALSGNNWVLIDNMRGMPVGSNDAALFPNLSSAEATGDYLSPTATGFIVNGTLPAVNDAGSTYIYIAIRRGPMKVPTSGTSIYNAIAYTKTNTTPRDITGAGFPPDLAYYKGRSGGANSGIDNNVFFDRLRGARSLVTNSSGAEAAGNQEGTMLQNGIVTSAAGEMNYETGTAILHFFRRAPSFFDEVCYTGTGSATTFSHNLGVAPEMMIVKGRTNTFSWFVYQKDLTSANESYLTLNTDSSATSGSAVWNSTSPTSSVFSVGSANAINQSGNTYVAYLFATCAGVSKVGSYTGTGTTKQVDCGFTGGARFVLIKKTSGTGSWYVWDSARGIVSGNDPYLLLNSTAAEVTSTDYIDTYSAGFEISSTAPSEINENGGSFIFLAIS